MLRGVLKSCMLPSVKKRGGKISRKRWKKSLALPELTEEKEKAAHGDTELLVAAACSKTKKKEAENRLA